MFSNQPAVYVKRLKFSANLAMAHDFIYGYRRAFRICSVAVHFELYLFWQIHYLSNPKTYSQFIQKQGLQC